MNRWFFIVWLGLTVVVVAPDLYRFADEYGHIKRLADELANGAETADELAAAYSLAVEPHLLDRDNAGSYDFSSRPFLRATAWETWTTRQGQCGESARLIVNLLISQGVPATRINMIGPGFVHTAVGYWNGDDWYLVDSSAAPGNFREWSQQNKRPISELVEMTFASGGGTPIRVRNPFFTRFSYFNWARVFEWGEINQRVPFPVPVVLLIENPPLLTGVSKFAAAVFVLLAGWLVLRRRSARRRAFESPSAASRA